jgi:hypothetical protein
MSGSQGALTREKMAVGHRRVPVAAPQSLPIGKRRQNPVGTPGVRAIKLVLL